MDHIEIFIDEKRLSSSQGTIELYSLVLRKFQEHMGKPIGQATRHDIVRYLNHIIFERKLSKATAANALSILKSFFSFMSRNEYLPADPTKGINPVKVDKKAPVYLTQDEMRELINTATGDRDSLMVKMLYATGVRVSELVNIRKQHRLHEGHHQGIRKRGQGADRAHTRRDEAPGRGLLRATKER